MRLDPGRGDGDFGGLAVTDAQIGVGHLDFHLKGARRRIGGARDKGDGACDLAVARGQPRLRLRAKADAVNLGLGDKAHQLDRVKLDHLRTKRSGLQQAAKLCGVAFQQPFERRGEGQPVNLGLGAGDGGLRSLNAGMCRIQPRLGRAECGARGGNSSFGGGQRGLRRKPAFAQFLCRVQLDQGFIQTGLRLGHAGLCLRDAGLCFVAAGLRLCLLRATGAGVQLAQHIARFHGRALAQRGRYHNG